MYVVEARTRVAITYFIHSPRTVRTCTLFYCIDSSPLYYHLLHTDALQPTTYSTSVQIPCTCDTDASHSDTIFLNYSICLSRSVTLKCSFANLDHCQFIAATAHPCAAPSLKCHSIHISKVLQILYGKLQAQGN